MKNPLPSKPLRTLALATGAALILSGCGGDSDSDPVYVAPSKPALSGTAAVGAAITGATVEAKCADGSGFSTSPVTTDANGNWRGVIDSAALPCALEVTGGTSSSTLYSYASSTGIVNITPLTTLALAHATSSLPADWFANFDGTPVDVNTAADLLMDALEDAGFTLPSSGNAFNTPFVADGTGWDGLLDDLQKAIVEDTNFDDLDDLVAVVKDGNFNSIPAAPADDTGGGDTGGGDGGTCGGNAEGTSELPAGNDLVSTCAGTHDIAFVHRDEPHTRGTVIIGEDNSIDFDTGIVLSPTDISTVYDRISCCNRIDVNYTSGDKVTLYRTDNGILR